MARKHDLKRVQGAYRRIDHEGICVYCGVRAETDDHFVPVSVAAMYADVIGLDRLTGLVILPSCRECNLLGGSKVFRDVAEKRRYIQGRIAARYRSLLESPHWTQEELAPMGRYLRGMIERGVDRRSLIWWRLKWRNTLESEPAIIAAVVFDCAGRRNGSALLDALPLGTRENATKSSDQLLRELTFQKRRPASERYGRPIADTVRPSGMPRDVPPKPARPALLQRSVFADVAEYRENAWLSDLRLDGGNPQAASRIGEESQGAEVPGAAAEDRHDDGSFPLDRQLFAAGPRAAGWDNYHKIKETIVAATEEEIVRMTKILSVEMGSSSMRYFYRSGGRSSLMSEGIRRGFFAWTRHLYLYATTSARDVHREWINDTRRMMPRPPHPIDALKALTQGPIAKRNVADNIILFLQKFSLVKDQPTSPSCIQLSTAGRKLIFGLAKEEMRDIALRDAARAAE